MKLSIPSAEFSMTEPAVKYALSLQKQDRNWFSRHVMSRTVSAIAQPILSGFDAVYHTASAILKLPIAVLNVTVGRLTAWNNKCPSMLTLSEIGQHARKAFNCAFGALFGIPVGLYSSNASAKMYRSFGVTSTPASSNQVPVASEPSPDSENSYPSQVSPPLTPVPSGSASKHSQPSQPSKASTEGSPKDDGDQLNLSSALQWALGEVPKRPESAPGFLASRPLTDSIDLSEGSADLELSFISHAENSLVEDESDTSDESEAYIDLSDLFAPDTSTQATDSGKDLLNLADLEKLDLPEVSEMTCTKPLPALPTLEKAHLNALEEAEEIENALLISCSEDEEECDITPAQLSPNDSITTKVVNPIASFVAETVSKENNEALAASQVILFQ